MKGSFLAALLSASLAGSLAILLVLPVRWLLRRSPKIFSYLLWAGVLFRLLCPAGIFVVSLPGPTPEPAAAWQQEIHPPEAAPDAGETGGQAGFRQGAAESGISWLAAAEILWLAGMAALALYGAASLLRLRRHLTGSVPLGNNIFLVDHLPGPFVLGLLRPRIYLPSGLLEQERDYLILHEQIHVHRGDHLVKLLAFGVLAVHWFNPLVWLAFLLLEQDMEMSCDEATLRRAKGDIRAAYAASLLKFAAGGAVSRTLPAFGEGETKRRVQNVMGCQRPSWQRVLSASALLLTVLLLAGCGMRQNEGQAEQDPGGSWMERYQVPEDFTSQATCAFVLSMEGEKLEADPAEYIQQQDTQRIQELNLDEQADMPDGYYIYNPDSQTEIWTLTPDTQYIFIDWGRDFVEDPETEDIVICTQDRQLFQQYLATYDNGRPGMPFFFEVEQGTVHRVIEFPFA